MTCGRRRGRRAHHGRAWRRGFGVPMGRWSRIAARLDLRASQQDVFEDLRDAWETAEAKIYGARRDADDADGSEVDNEIDDALRGFDRAEKRAAAWLESIRAVKPAFEAFYAKLDDAQKDMVDSWFGRPWFGWRYGW